MTRTIKAAKVCAGIASKRERIMAELTRTCQSRADASQARGAARRTRSTVLVLLGDASSSYLVLLGLVLADTPQQLLGGLDSSLVLARGRIIGRRRNSDLVGRLTTTTISTRGWRRWRSSCGHLGIYEHQKSARERLTEAANLPAMTFLVVVLKKTVDRPGLIHCLLKKNGSLELEKI